MKKTCFAIALTGGIASGKSAVSRIFENLGANVIDADIIARDVVKINSKGLKQLVDNFGVVILLDDGSLDRSKLRQLVFNNRKKLNQLNSITHPLIHEEIKKQVSQVSSKYCILVIPLLCESKKYDWIDRILVVDVKADTQLTRLMIRDSINEELAHNMLNSQCSRKQRLKIADDVVNNDSNIKSLKSRISDLHHLYTLISRTS